ncbi:ROK family transcriptional regulator [uncultured Cohaesibacter sp.]|uniref:ROK family transcriptional regulator n=1 Tax=uncultured Cohaesibacter sp. TaxID=1002546 RepID=UPI0029312F78|nr:ROK family transcriptional regulator [uncultured Cohaesibacter sp.]
MARIDIANATGMSPATVTAITAELIAAGLIEEVQRVVEPGQSKRGRPRVDLKLHGKEHIVAGMKLTGRWVTAVILDLEGNQLGRAQVPMPRPPLSRQTLLELVPKVIDAVTKDADMAPEDLSAIGIGIPGTVQATTGFVDWCPLFQEQEINLKYLLQDSLPMPVFVENDANSVAMAELWFGFGKDVPDFLVVTIEEGLGLGIVLDGKIFRGTQGFGAEFGHTKVQSEGALCRCGQRGCLEAYVADYALLREASLFRKWEESISDEDRLIQLYDAAKAGDQTSKSIFDRASRMFAMGLANLVNLFDPSLVILSGEQMRFDYLYAQAVFDIVRNSTIQKGHHQPEIRVHKWGDMMWAKGAAAYALEEIVRLSIDQLGNSDAHS